MSILRLAYTTQFLIALIAVFFLWSEVGGQGHLDLMPWFLKLALGVGAAFAVVKATSAAVSHEHAWNGGTLKWLGIIVALLVGCGLASYYCHMYLESDEGDDQQDSASYISEMQKQNDAPGCSAPLLDSFRAVALRPATTPGAEGNKA
jgi:hypothetical protein